MMKRPWCKHAAFVALVGASIALVPASLAVAQIQTQGMTVGGPFTGTHPKKLTRAECTAQGKEKGLRGAKLRAYVNDCLSG